MFHLVNPFGNVHKHVKSEAKKNELLKDGWKVVEEPEKTPKGNAKGKSKKTEKE